MNDIIRIEATPKEVELAGTAAKLLAAAEALEIHDDTDAGIATDMAKQLASKTKALNDERLAITKPFRDGVDAINDRFKKLSETIATANGIVRGKLLEHSQLKEALANEQREADRLAQEEREKAARLEREQEEAKRAASPESSASASPVPALPEIAPVFVQKAPPKVETTRTRSEGGAVASIKKVWKARIIDVAALAQAHPELVLANMAQINASMQAAKSKDGKTIALELPGVEFYQEDQLGVR